MKSRRAIKSILSVAVMLPILTGTGIVSAQQPDPEYTSRFMLKKCNGFSSVGRNPFFVLEPGFETVLAGEDEGVKVRVAISVLHQTKMIDGIQTRVLKEVETKNGKLYEVATNYFAICNRTNSVVYFGEDVDFYENGVVVSHDGSWRAGVNGAKPGIIMPGTVLLGARYFQEVAPKVALDRAEIVSLSEVVQTPAGKFEKCLKTKETTPLEPDVREFKWYAPGIGLIRDGVLKLVWRSPNDAREREEADMD